VYEVRESTEEEYAGVVNIVRMRTHYKIGGMMVLA
jgi:hypothetical protein